MRSPVRSMFRYALVLIVPTLLPVLTASPAQAQTASEGEVVYLRFGQGTSDFAGAANGGAGFGDFSDSERFTGDEPPYAFVLEFGYRFSPSLSVGMGYQLGSYYHTEVGGLDAGSRILQTVQLLGRYKPGAQRWIVTPYLDLGVNVSSGIDGMGLGPSVGGGLSVTIDEQLAFFVESRLNLTFPDESAESGLLFDRQGIIPSISRGEVPIDVLTVLPAVGFEFELR